MTRAEPDEATLVAVPDVEEFDRRELMAMEKEMTGLYLSGHPMDEYRDAARPRGGPCPSGPYWRTLPQRTARRTTSTASA